MSDKPHSLRVPRWLWAKHAAVVGDIGRTADLKLFMDWKAENPDRVLGPDVSGPHDLLTTILVEQPRWDLFFETVGDGDCSIELRRYIAWRVEHPTEPLPGRRTPPLRRQSCRAACV